MREIRENPPTFVRSNDAIYHFETILDLLEQNDVPLKTQDSYGIGVLALNYAMIDSAVESINTDGMMMDVQGDRHQIKKINPAIATLKDAQANVRHWSEKFQMSPQSRGKGFNLSASQGKNKDDGFGDV